MGEIADWDVECWENGGDPNARARFGYDPTDPDYKRKRNKAPTGRCLVCQQDTWTHKTQSCSNAECARNKGKK